MAPIIYCPRGPAQGHRQMARRPAAVAEGQYLTQGWEEVCLCDEHSPDSGGREWKRLVFAKPTPGFLGRESGKGLFLQNPLSDFLRVGVETAKNCKKHSHAFPEREWKSQESSKSTLTREREGSAFSENHQFPLSQVEKEGVQKAKNQEIHSPEPKPKECKSPKSRKSAPTLQNRGSAKVQKARNTLPGAL